MARIPDKVTGILSTINRTSVPKVYNPSDPCRAFCSAPIRQTVLAAAELRFRVRETPEWQTHAGALEAEMLKRGMFFQIIDWSEIREHCPWRLSAAKEQTNES
jgi:hypothetical protein